MKDYINALKENKKLLTITIVSFVAFLVLLVGATYAYFGVDQTNNTSVSNITATTESVGSVTLVDGSSISLSLTADDMAVPSKDVTFWATESGEISLEEDNVVIATANVIGDVIMYCDYKMTVKQSAESPETDMYQAFKNWSGAGKGNDHIVMKINNNEPTNNIQTYDFNDAGLSFPVTYNGRLTGLVEGEARNITANFKIVNKADVDQTVLAGKNVKFTFTFTDFECEIQGSGDPLNETMVNNRYASATGQNLTTWMYDNKATIPELWTTGYEGDGVRFVGTGSASNEKTPDNFICFGTTSKETCTANPSKYMYRIIGIFPDSSGGRHLKLIKYESLTSLYQWHSSSADVAWGSNTLATNLNAGYFLTNTAYDYMQNTTWSNKITNWTWSAVNTQTSSNSGPDYSMGSMKLKDIYLHEMNRTRPATYPFVNPSSKENASGNFAIGTWASPQAKIGIMYASDYLLSQGKMTENITTSTPGDLDQVQMATKYGWLDLSYNSTGVKTGTVLPQQFGYNYEQEWTMARAGNISSLWQAYAISKIGILFTVPVNGANSFILSVRPVFYLNSNVVLNSGSGTLADPLIIN